MEPNSREFALFIDGIRIERNMSRDDLIDGIISLSQYKRYLRGATAIPNNVVLQIADRLKYSINDFYSLFSKKHNNEYDELLDIYALVRSQKYREALQSCHKMKDELIVSSYNKLFYDYLFIHSQHMLGQISDIHILGIYSDLVDYPECMKNESFNMVELSIILQIVRISARVENYEPALLTYKILTNATFLQNYTGDSSVLPIVYYYTAGVFRQQEDFDSTLELSLEGINRALFSGTTNALPHLYLISGLAYKELGHLDKALQQIKECFLLLIVLKNPGLTESFKTTYNSNFDIPLEELLSGIHKLL